VGKLLFMNKLKITPSYFILLGSLSLVIGLSVSFYIPFCFLGGYLIGKGVAKSLIK
jgi:hypothetical protein